jgi:hypothetical protein
MNQAREAFTLTLLVNGRVLAAGGLATNGTLASAEVFDPGTGLWTSTGSMTTNRAFHTATLLPNGKVLVTGGMTEFGASASNIQSAELYDPSAGTWTAANPMMEPRSDHTACLLPNGKVLVAGGVRSDDYPTVTELYDPASGTWTPTVPLAAGREGHSAVVLLNGTVLIMGGFNVGPLDVGAEELYNPASMAGVPILLTGAAKLPNGAFQFGFTNTPGAIFNIFVTTNTSQPLINWTDLGGVAEVSSGHYQFTDSGATNTLGFYRVISP